MYMNMQAKDQRKSQISLLNFMDKDRRDSKEFLFPDEKQLHRRRKSAPDNSDSQSEDDDNGGFEVFFDRPM